MRFTFLLLVLTFPCFAGDEIDTLVDRLFSKDAGQRAAARKALLARDDAALAQVLARIEARRPAPTVLQIYNVSDLRNDVRNWPGAQALIRNAADGAKTIQFDAKRGVVIVLCSKGVHQKITEQLNMLRRAQGELVQIHAWFVETEERQLDLPSELAAGDVNALVDRVKGKVVSSPRLACRNGQRASVEMIRQVSFIEDFDIGVANGACILDPVVGVAQAGVTVEVRPVISPEGGVQLATTARRTILDLPFPSIKVPTITGQTAEIQVPALRTVAVVTLVMCKPGRAVVVNLGEGAFVVITASATRIPAAADNDGTREKK